ncbi:hypothetical protein M0L20_02890 [Spirosoma sp. RP8]|uniref:Uncharacterized protein n=1 Tax=Spirosoma liriopis TaxID=2937440 RepID=A0ABT0HF42_9BACT|nr:hypothetical protein [Spirosoma liriopis]MCK8490781.1 hypothetical protein [Spirosoma liriopis]
MKLLISSVWLSALWLLTPDSIFNRDSSQPTAIPVIAGYEKTLRFNVYTFKVSATDSGAMRDVSVKAYRGAALLTNFRMHIDGAVVGAEVADLDKNRFPELYLYSTSDGSGSFGRVYGWQFLPERKADIQPENWFKKLDGYMGHDSLWTERDVLCRKFPVYNAGDVNAKPTGGARMLRYRLRPAGQSFVLVADSTTQQSVGR